MNEPLAFFNLSCFECINILPRFTGDFTVGNCRQQLPAPQAVGRRCSHLPTAPALCMPGRETVRSLALSLYLSNSLLTKGWDGARWLPEFITIVFAVALNEWCEVVAREGVVPMKNETDSNNTDSGYLLIRIHHRETRSNNAKNMSCRRYVQFRANGIQ